MAEADLRRIEPDPRPIHDQIIDHDLVGKSAEQMLGILIIELRRLRVQIAELNDNVRRPAD